MAFSSKRDLAEALADRLTGSEADARAIAISRIEEARESGRDTLDLSDLRLLTTLPEELATLQSLRNLFAGDRRPDGETRTNERVQLSDISSVRYLPNLTTLDLTLSKVKDLSPIENIEALNALYLSFTEVTELSSLSALINLTKLDVSFNAVTDLSPLIALKELKSLDLKERLINGFGYAEMAA